MGLNGLVSRNVAGYVKNFELTGEWKEHEVQEHAKVGRVPDESMMLNSLVRVAVERMAVLDSFSWKLNTKMLPTIWQGLAQRSSLTKLTVKFPIERHPRPITLVPPIPSLEYLHIFDIDPLCYVDDVSLLFLGSKKLRDLKMHWSPRMREAREPSIHQAAYFGKCAAAHYALPLRSIAVQNLYTHHEAHCGNVIDFSKLEEVTYLNSTGGLDDDGGTEFMDGTGRKSGEDYPTNLKMCRVDKHSRQQCEFLASIKGLERLYLIGPYRSNSTRPNGTTTEDRSLPRSPTSNTSSPPTTSTTTDCSKLAALKDDYIRAITRNHGPTLKHLLLLPQWRLTDTDIATIVRSCPNLEQLGIGVEAASFSHLRLLVPFLSRLSVFRLLPNPNDPGFVNTMREYDERGLHEAKMGEETVSEEWSRLRYAELGAEDMIFELGKRRLVDGRDVRKIVHDPCQANGEVGEKGERAWRRPVFRRSLESVKHIDIWKMDSLDL
ncbi:hypothetical protein ACLMJK_000842 [Lecanora helva]